MQVYFNNRLTYACCLFLVSRPTSKPVHLITLHPVRVYHIATYLFATHRLYLLQHMCGIFVDLHHAEYIRRTSNRLYGLKTNAKIVSFLLYVCKQLKCHLYGKRSNTSIPLIQLCGNNFRPHQHSNKRLCPSRVHLMIYGLAKLLGCCRSKTVLCIYLRSLRFGAYRWRDIYLF